VPVRTVSTFFALLTLAAFAAVLGAAVLAVAARRSPAAADLRSRLGGAVAPSSLALAALVASVATAGSLYYSEVANFPPCTLCWVQRGFMYPLAPLLWVAAFAGWQGVRTPARLMAGVGGSVSAWHIAVERLPALQSASGCDPTVPCSLVWVKHFGFITIPVMALAAFGLLIVLLSTRPTTVDAEASAEELEHV
jgi:disulfide bond formation protein DsbB